MEPTAPSPELQAYLLEHQDNLVTHIIQFNELMSRYQAAVKEVSTKLEILKSDFQIRNRRSSIESIQSRIRKPVSILKKLNGRGIEVKDYIRNPKPNGYRSYHMIVEVPVFFMDAKESMRVEVQLRTVAMDFWASLEHEIKYKKEIENDEQLIQDLKACADVIAETDRKMLELRERMRRDSQGTFKDTADEQQEKAPGIPT